MTNLINVAAYCRVSTDNTDQLHSLSAQIAYFTDYISQNENWCLKEVYYDEGLSGVSVKKRISFNRMITDSENGEIDLILTKEVSRFARNTVDTLTYTRRLSAKNVGVIFTSDNIDTRDKDGELRLTIMASIAQEESRKTSERTKWGLRRSLEKGTVHGPRTRFGYRTINGVITVVPEEAETLRRMYNAYVYDGMGCYKIAQELNANKKFTVTGTPWTGSTVLQIMKREIYVGDLVQGKRQCVDYLTKTYKKTAEETHVIFRDNHEAIIDRKTWELAQKTIKERGLDMVENLRRHSTKHWFSGKMSCGACGWSYISNGGNNVKSHTLHCENRRGNGKNPLKAPSGKIYGCSNKGINEKVLLKAMECIMGYIGQTRNEVIDDLLREIAEMQQSDEIINTVPLENEIEKLNTKKRNAIDLMLEDLISKDDLKKQTEFYDSEIVRLNEEIHQSKNINSVHSRQIKKVQEYIVKVKETANITEYNTDIYRELLEKVLVNNDSTIDVYLNCVPFGFKVVYHTSGGTKNWKIHIDSCAVIA